MFIWCRHTYAHGTHVCCLFIITTLLYGPPQQENILAYHRSYICMSQPSYIYLWRYGVAVLSLFKPQRKTLESPSPFASQTTPPVDVPAPWAVAYST